MRKRLALAAVCLGTFTLLVDATAINVALPDMANDLHTYLGAAAANGLSPAAI